MGALDFAIPAIAKDCDEILLFFQQTLAGPVPAGEAGSLGRFTVGPERAKPEGCRLCLKLFWAFWY